MEGKAAISLAAFTLGTSQCIFFPGFRVQKDREILADRTKSGIEHGLRRSPDNDPVVIAERVAEQLIAYCSSDQIGLIRQFHGSRIL